MNTNGREAKEQAFPFLSARLLEELSEMCGRELRLVDQCVQVDRLGGVCFDKGKRLNNPGAGDRDIVFMRNLEHGAQESEDESLQVILLQSCRGLGGRLKNHVADP